MPSSFGHRFARAPVLETARFMMWDGHGEAWERPLLWRHAEEICLPMGRHLAMLSRNTFPRPEYTASSKVIESHSAEPASRGMFQDVSIPKYCQETPQFATYPLQLQLWGTPLGSLRDGC